MTFVLRKTQNGWIVTDDTGYMSREDVKNCYVFERMTDLTKHLIRELGESQPRDNHGKFKKAR